MRGILKDHVLWGINDLSYKKGMLVEVAELDGFPNCYAVYQKGNLD